MGRNRTPQRASDSTRSAAPEPAPKKPAAESSSNILDIIARVVLYLYFVYTAITIRLYAVMNYGRVIHEFDPWFNYRATEYLVAHGYSAFVDWFDYESWYPIGRPVGTTIYPGMMITASGIYHTLNFFGFDVSVNDVCVFIPAGMAALTITFVYLLTYEITLSHNSALIATGLMSIIPSHLMRSVAGGYDNESVAMCLIVSTFYFWIRSLRDESSWWIGVFTGLSYASMAATWGAYTYVLNLIAVHAFVLILLGRYSRKMHLAYSLFFIIGTAGALQFPIVGWQPFDSMEQISALLVFILLQLIAVLYAAADSGIKVNLNDKKIRFYFMVSVVVVGGIALSVALSSGALLPVTARIRGLFVQHTKTGNPLVDSVAEHQSTPPDVYANYFNFVSLLAPIGFILSFFLVPVSDSQSFFWCYFLTAAYFSQKMIRLVLLLSTPACVAASIVMSLVLEWVLGVLTGTETPVPDEVDTKKKKVVKAGGFEVARKKYNEVSREFRKHETARNILAALIFLYILFMLNNFYVHSNMMAARFSEPQVILTGRSKTGQPLIIDDFREAYFWLKNNTPEDSRVLSWWDYGYQINGIANRTTLADGNTWNHEHIALIGKTLISPEAEAHKIARHLADYVLVWSTRWAGMMGDDLAKCPHMARIAGSVFFDVPFKEYYMLDPQTPSPMLSKSLLFQIHSYGFNPSVPKPKYFEEAYTTGNRMVRIFKVKNVSKESKEYCAKHHAYPPALDSILEQRNNFQRDREHQFLNL